MSRVGSLLALLAAMFAAAPSLAHAPTPAAAPAPAPRTPLAANARVAEPTRAALARTTVWITGDLLFEPELVRAARPVGEAEGLARMLGPLSEVVRGDGEDLGAFIVNLETPVATQRRESDYVDAEAFRARTGHKRVPVALDAPRSVLPGLVRAGVTAVSLANNHALDQTRDGLGETLDSARAAGLSTLGAGRTRDEAEAPLVVGAPGARVAVLAVFLRDNPEPALPDGTPRLATVDPATLAAVRRARHEADVVVVVVHVVAELETRPSPAFRMLVDHLVDIGVDAVVAHGPHVVAPVERIGHTTVAWSIGNLLSDMGHSASPLAHHIDEHDKRQTARTRVGLVARIEARQGEPPRVGFLPIFVRTDRFLVDHGFLPAPVDYRVTPLRARGPALDLPQSWPEELHAPTEAWLDAQRDALLRTARLRAPSHDGPPALLAP